LPEPIRPGTTWNESRTTFVIGFALLRVLRDPVWHRLRARTLRLEPRRCATAARGALSEIQPPGVDHDLTVSAVTQIAVSEALVDSV
jgi:hypothetical protein